MGTLCAAISACKRNGVLEDWSDGVMKEMKSKLLKVFPQYSNTPLLQYSNLFQRIRS
jgi:hypothetical protein